MTIFQELSAPFAPEAIHWRAQQVFERDGAHSALALAYIDARDVMDRLDAVCGPANWTDTYEETPKGRLICRLSLCVEGIWVMKSDGAGDTDVEGSKGAISDALKRTGVKWGIGRYLYDLGNTYAPCEAYDTGRKSKSGKTVWGWKKWKPEADKVFADALKKVSRPSGPITDATREWLGAQLQSVGKAPADLFRELAPKDLRDLTYEQLPRAQQFINSNKKAA